MPKKTIVYIAGYGRSGSTLLARILGSHKKMFAAGELINFANLMDSRDSVCSCGQTIERCALWSVIVQNFKKKINSLSELADIQKRFESFSYFFRPFFEDRSSKAIRYRDTIQNLMDCISQKLPDDVEYIVDSSKTTWSRCFRPVSLSRIGSQQVKVIHLVRDGRGCMWSMLKGTDTGLLKDTELKPYSSFPVFRTAVHWPFANATAHLFQAIHPSKDYFRIRYEDLVANPVKTCAALGEFLGIRLEHHVEKILNGNDIDPGHIIAGNRMRSFRKITLKADVEWKKRLKRHHQLLFLFLNWPLMLFYSSKPSIGIRTFIRRT